MQMSHAALKSITTCSYRQRGEEQLMKEHRQTRNAHVTCCRLCHLSIHCDEQLSGLTCLATQLWFGNKHRQVQIKTDELQPVSPPR
jgi:hypothetical protein